MKRNIKFKKTFSRAAYKAKKRSPEILVVTGCIGVTAAAIFACKATPKAVKVMDEHKKNLSAIKESKAAVEKGEIKNYSIADYRKDLTAEYGSIAKDMAKSYGPSVLLGGASIGCILTSHKMMKGRNTALAAAYATANRSYRQLKSAADAKYGLEASKDLRYGTKEESVEEVVTDKDGNQKKVKEKMKVRDDKHEPIGPYVVKYDERCPQYEPNQDFQDAFFDHHISYLNQKLQIEGFLFLNDIYKDLGFPCTAVGQYDGWIWEEGKAEDIIDIQIDRIFNKDIKEHEIWLDFNPRENIVEYVFRKK